MILVKTLEFHDEWGTWQTCVEDGVSVLKRIRVPGGWMYVYVSKFGFGDKLTSVFVPLEEKA